MTIPSDLTGKVAIVTGGGRGIGKAIAFALAAAGARVVIAEIDDDTGRQAEKDLQSQGYEAHFVHTDVASSDSIKAAVTETVDVFGSLDIAVNNAGISTGSATIAELDETKWAKTIDINLSGVAFCLKWELQQMIKQGLGGSIVNVSSVGAIKPRAGMSAYCATKEGVLSLTRIAAMENGCNNIRVNAVAPGMTKTEILRNALTEIGASEEAVGQQSTLFGRCANPEEIAESVLWLASERASYVTGIVMPVDGGYSLM